MKKSFLIPCLLLASAWVLSAQEHPDTRKDQFPALYSPEDKIYALSTVWSELKYNFVYMDRVNFNVDSLYCSYLPQVLDTRNDVEFFGLLKRFVARFNDGHTSVYRYSYQWNDVHDFAPLMVEELNGRYYLSQLWESSQLDSLALGAEIVRIEGIPTRQYVEEHYFPSLAAGSKAAKYNLAASEIGTGFPGSYFRADLEYRDGRNVSVCIENNFYRLMRDKRIGRSWEWKGFRNGQRETIALDWPQNRIARLSFRKFDDESIPVMDSLLTTLSSRAEALIIDLRYCSGGSSIVGDSLATRIVDADYFLTGGSRMRINNGYGRAQGNYRPEYEDYYNFRAYGIEPSDTIRIDRSKVLTCPIVVLVGGMTASAAETFLIRIYELPKRPPIIGQRTSGSTGAPLVIDLPHGACVRICTRCQLFPISGKPFVNEGIAPDVEIMPTAEDHIQGHDRVLEYTIKMLGEILKL